MRLIGLKDSRSDGGLLAVRRGIMSRCGSRDIFSRMGKLEHVKEFDCIEIEIFKKRHLHNVL